ncbi:MAG: hypothetical protein HW412_2642, partial [Bacteroidetes bacterium]|nr:hypothetical protein [Bacteroidota bacterium]
MHATGISVRPIKTPRGCKQVAVAFLDDEISDATSFGR